MDYLDYVEEVETCRLCKEEFPAEEVHPRLVCCAECMHLQDDLDATLSLKEAWGNRLLKSTILPRLTNNEIRALVKQVREIRSRGPQFYYDVIERAGAGGDGFPTLAPETSLMSITLARIYGSL